MNKFKNKIFKISAVLTLLWAGLLFAQTALAQNDTFGLSKINQNVNLAGGDIRVTAAKIISAALGLLGIVTVALVLYGGYLYMTAAGNEEQVGKAKKIIINATIGLAIILSAFAITQFVLNTLNKAINGQEDLGGGEGGDGDNFPPGVCDTTSPDYNEAQCTSQCKSHPELAVCKKLAFFVESITPSTLAGDATGMNDITLRALFSHPLDPATDLGKALVLKKDGDAASLPITVTLANGGRVLEAVYKNDNQTVPAAADKKYSLIVNSEIKDIKGKNLDTNYSVDGVKYSTTANFIVDKEFSDATAPVIQNLTLNNNGGSITVAKGQQYTVGAKVGDRVTVNYGGVGLIHITISAANASVLVDDYVAPTIEVGSSAEFLVAYNGIISSQFTIGQTYTLTVSAFDINHKNSSASMTFKVVASHCSNGFLDFDETSADAGGSCGGGAGSACVKNEDCATGFQCVDKICTAAPLIEQVDPMNGASGNWITILGKHFGSKLGKIEFATDFNKNGKYDLSEWVPAEVVSCDSGKPNWNSDWVVAQVPDGANAPVDSAVNFNGTDGHVEMNGDTLEFTNAVTFEAWVNPSVSGAYTTILGKTDVATKNGYFFALNNLQPALWLSGLSTPGWLTANTKVALNTWSHVVVTYDGSSVRFYINGNLDKAIKDSGSIAALPDKKFWIGMREDFGTKSYQFKGKLDEMGVYNKVLTAAQILAHYNEAQKVDGIYDGLVNQDGPLGYWRFGEVNGATAFDSSPHKIDGTYLGGITLNQTGIFGLTTKKIGIGAKSAIRLTMANGTSFDTTIDDFGPKPNGDGLFIKNDIKRPGLCRVGVTKDTTVTLAGKDVTLPADNPAALPEVPVTAHGSGFGTLAGTSKITFGAKKDPSTGNLTGGFQGEVKGANDWTDLAIKTKVPENLKPGALAVHVTSAGQSSNGVKFNIISPDASQSIPQISSIDPVSTTPKSYITIKGTGFGNSVGHVYIADSKDHLSTCGSAVPDASCRDLNVDTFPVKCGVTWNDTQVIAEIPDGTTAAKYHVAVKNTFNFQTSGVDEVEVLSGLPRPSICRLDPAKGPAPLPTDSAGINIYGINFGTSPVVYYWQPNAKPDNYATWLNSITNTTNGEADGSSVIKGISTSQITTLLPLNSNGSSLAAGANPIKVKTDAAMSNGVYYEVEKCTDAKKPLVGYHCCDKGPDKDVWKKNSQMCSGENREAGYVWRFYTGIIPYSPSVVEQCDGVSFPSPTPRKINGVNDASCLNSSLAVRFSMTMDPKSITKDTVKVYACATSDKGQIDCATKKEPVTPLDLLYQTGANTLIIRQVPPQTTLSANTWYQVELSEKVRSQQYSVIFGVGQYTSSTLAVTKPCGAGSAYCFAFKTGTEECTLAGAGINPPNYTTHQLGVIQDPKYPFDNSQFYAPPNLPPNPYYYFVWGKGNQECSVINVDGFPWKWMPKAGATGSDKAIAFKAPLSPYYVNSRAAVSAESHTAPDAVIISAQADAPASGLPSQILWNDALKISNIQPGTPGSYLFNPLFLGGSNWSLNYPPFTLDLDYRIQDSNLGILTRYVMYKSHSYGLVYLAGGAKEGLCFVTLDQNNIAQAPLLCTKEVPQNNQEYHYILRWDGFKLRWYNKVGQVISESDLTKTLTESSDPLNIGKEPINLPALKSLSRIWYSFKVAHSFVPDIQIQKYLTPPQLQSITATSNLIVDLYDPAVVAYEPNCIESCVNAAIRVQFNRQMDPDTYAAGFKVYRCPDGVECQKAEEVKDTDKDYYTVNSPGTDGGSDTQTLAASLGSGKVLSPNIYYKVSLNSTGPWIKALNSVTPKKQGKHLPMTEWVFKTKADATPCSVGAIHVAPTPFTATAVGQQDKFTATPYSLPNACSKLGQALNKWDYNYAWSTADGDKVAKVSQIGAASLSNISPFCTNFCVKKGSTVSKNSSKVGQPLCGNKIKENGEDCDIGIAGETVGVSCTLNCLRPGNSAGVTPKDFASNNLCGNGTTENNVGEQCDPGHDAQGNIKKDDLNCTEQCLWRGSVQDTGGKVNVSSCGNNTIDKAEACDIADPLSQNGCTQSCLHKGTLTAAVWCADHKSSSQWDTSECQQSVSVCGNGHLEPSEECEVGVNGVTSDLCNDQCLFAKACTVGATPNLCKPSGSSPNYAQPSLCGDGTVGAGEDIDCEVKVGAGSGAGPTQIVEAKGEGTIAAGTTYQQTKIKASITTKVKVVEGAADYQLMCGYHEFVAPDTDGKYNDCQANIDNHLGVSAQSCCVPRPKWLSVYPNDGAGINGSAGICRNTLVQVRFTKEMRPDTILNNIFLVRAHGEANFKCASSTFDATDVVKSTLQYSQANAPLGFWASLWESIKNFFAYLTGGFANASTVKNSADVKDKVWCANEVPVNVTTKVIPPEINDDGDIVVPTSTVTTLGIQALLDKSAVYGVLMRGEVGGMVDINGVPLGAHDGLGRNDIWFFKTNNSDQACKITGVKVDPSGHLFTAPNTAFTFSALATTDKGQQLTPIPGIYAWEWSWQPAFNPVFAIPTVGTSANQDTISISSKNVEGHIAGIAVAKVTTDNTGNNVVKDQKFTGTFDLNALFCAQPWPAVPNYPYKDTKYNMSFSYCSDAGKAGDLNDDLPYLKDPLEFLKSDVAIPQTCTVAANSCQSNADCTPTLYNVPTLGQTTIPNGTGICWNGGANAPQLSGGQVVMCQQMLECISSGSVSIVKDAQNLTIQNKSAFIVSPHLLSIYDVANSASINLSGVFGNSDGDITDLQVANNLAYFVSWSNGGLRIVDVTNPAAPQLKKTVNFYSILDQFKVNDTKKYQDAGTYEKVAVYTPKGVVTVYIYNHLDAQIAIVHNFDQNGNGLPEFPPLSDYKLVDNNGDLWIQYVPTGENLVKFADTHLPIIHAAIDGTTAYLMVGGDTLTKPKIYVLDMKDPVKPTLLSTLPLSLATSEIVTNLKASNGKLVLGTNQSRIYVVDVSNTATPKLTTTVDLPKGASMSTVDKIEMVGNHAILSLTGFGAGASSIDLSASPMVATAFGSYGPGLWLNHNGNALYISNGSKVDRLEFKGGIVPEVTKTYPVSANATSISGDTLFYITGSATAKKLSTVNLAIDPAVTTCKTEFDSSWKNICKPIKDTINAVLAKDTLKKQLFFNDKNGDAIGLQIFSLKQEDSESGFVETNLKDWYTKTKGFETLGDMKETTVAGYNALTDGNNYYILALNYDPASAEQVYSNVYLLSINPNAQPETREVFSRILKNLNFNINLTDHNYCLSTTGNIRTSPDDISTQTTDNCATDFDCRDNFGTPKPGTNGICSNAKTKFGRDWRRLHDIKAAQDYLDGYFTHNLEPDFKGNLAGGSFVPGYTMSRWGQSWGLLQKLSGSNGGIQSDPINQWTDCGSGGADKQTCWDASQTTYFCPKFASVYEYEYVNATKDYIFHAPLEFFTLTDSLTDKYINLSKFSPDRWTGCATGSYNPFNQKCGDGVLGPTEECDPPGTIITSGTSCKIGQVSTKTCTNSCAWSIGACQSIGQCGNGIVEFSEVCDDGALNNTYGHCKGGTPAEGGCQGLFVAYCGNGKIDVDSKNKSLEFCEAGLNGYTTNYNLDKNKSCSWDCQGVGGYCGDKIIQKDSGEECDDGTTDGKGLCTDKCKIKKTCDYAAVPDHACYIDENCPVTELTGGLKVPAADTAKVCMYTGDSGTVPIFTKKIGNDVNTFICKIDSDCKNVTFYGGVNTILYADKSLPTTGLKLSSKDYFAVDRPEFSCETLDIADTYHAGDFVACKIPSFICGNGKIEGGEQCDDSNTSSGDGCSNVCLTEGAPASCGNSKIEPELGEKCDLGAQNGVPCDPGYGAGKSCVYCSGDCKSTQTVDATAYCGDGIIQKDQGEVCDVKTDGSVVKPIDQCPKIIQSQYLACLKDPVWTCADKGSYQCTNSCTLLANQCVACDRLPGKPMPAIHFINPLSATSPFTLETTAELYHKNKDQQNPWSLLSQNAANGTSNSDWTIAQYALTIPPGSPTGYPLFVNKTDGIETNLLCDQSYGLTFNRWPIVDKIGGQSLSSLVTDDRLSIFPYPVKGEVTNLVNDYIYSPAVPKGVFRVVLKWTNEEQAKGASFNTYVYNDSFLGTGQDPVDWDTSAQSYLTYQQKNQNGVDFLCTWYDKNNWADGTSVYLKPTAQGNHFCLSTKNLYFNDIVHTAKVYVQSVSIDTRNNPDGTPYAFFVSSLDQPSITKYMNSKLEVWVYGYHAGQVPLYSIYTPDQIFKFASTTEDNTGVNLSAQYWHAFSLVKQDSDYVVKPINKIDPTKPVGQKKIGVYANGSIETDFSRILDNLDPASVNL